jgi:sugar lactone lactonase YvrE
VRNGLQSRLWPAPVLALGLALVLAGGCATRDHDNPLDPENPETGGEPRWLDAVAGNSLVELSWFVEDFVDLNGVRLVDTGGGTLLWTGPPGTGEFTHIAVPNGMDRFYRLELVLATGRVLDLPEEVATPGPAVPWVYDLGTGTVARLTPDGRRVRRRYPDADAVSVAADPGDGSVLVLEFYAGAVVRVSPEGAEVWRVDDLFRPSAGLRVAGGWWVADTGLGAVFLYDEDGGLVFSDSSFTFPVDLAPGDSGSVWVADRGGPVVRLHPGSGVVAADTLDSPYAVCATGDGGVWVADREAAALVRLGPEGGETARAGNFPGVEGLAEDPVSDGAWVADRGGDRVLLIDGAGGIVRKLTGFPAPSSIAVSPDGGTVWVADPVVGEVVRMSRSGEDRIRSEGLTSPLSISIAFAPEVPVP